MKPLVVGDLTIESLGIEEPRVGSTVSKRESKGQARLYSVRGPELLHLCVADIVWENGERDIRGEKRFTSPQRYDQLVERLRLGVYRTTEGDLWFELKQARLKSENHSNLFHASADELDGAAGVDVHATLLAHGAKTVGSREEVFGDVSRQRACLCVVFPESAALLPVVAFAITRVAPVLHRVTAEEGVLVRSATKRR